MSFASHAIAIGSTVLAGERMRGILDAVVISAGSAELGVSYFLQQRGCAHHVLEQGRIGETWRTQRWDSFRLNSTNIRRSNNLRGEWP